MLWSYRGRYPHLVFCKTIRRIHSVRFTLVYKSIINLHPCLIINLLLSIYYFISIYYYLLFYLLSIYYFSLSVPFGGCIRPEPAKRLRCLKGIMTLSWMSRIVSSSPPMSSQSETIERGSTRLLAMHSSYSVNCKNNNKNSNKSVIDEQVVPCV